MLKKFSLGLLMIAIQAAALLMLLGIIQGGFHLFQWRVPLWMALGLQALFACAITVLLRRPRWWIWIAIFLPLLFVAFQFLQLPVWIFPLLIILLAGFFWNAGDEQVPLYLSNRTTWKSLSTQIAHRPEGQFADLGCGFGGTLFYLSKQHPNWHFHGVETAPFAYLVCKIRQILLKRSNLAIHYSSLWDQDFSKFDVIYAFLSPAPMNRLLEKAYAEMRPNSQLISNSFTSTDYVFDEVIPVLDQRQTQLYLWNFTEK